MGTFQTPNLHDQCNRLDRPLASAEMDYRVPDDGHLVSIVELDIRNHFFVQIMWYSRARKDVQIKIQVIINTKFDGSNYRFQKFTIQISSESLGSIENQKTKCLQLLS